MNISEYIKQEKEIYNLLINYINDENDFEGSYQSLINNVDSQNQENFQVFLHLLLEISKYHHRDSDFFNKIETILIYFQERIKQTFSNSKIFKLFKTNKRILFFLFKNKIIIPDKNITFLILQQSKTHDKKFHKFFYPEIKSFIDEKWKEKIEKELGYYNFDSFEEKRQLGENDSYICSLIRNDSIEEFVSYVNRTNLNLSTTIIQHSIFETNTFLLKKKETKLIEYACFFGSIQIFQYLRLNNVELTKSLWIYAIHSRNAELIHLLEENRVEPEDATFEECFEESIKCHHNEIAEYILTNLIDKKSNLFTQKVIDACFHFYNFMFLPDIINAKDCLECSCKYNYLKLVKLFFKNKDSISNEKINYNSLLHFAADRNNYQIVNFLLLSHKFDISSYFLKQCKKLTQISIPSGATQIGFYAFDGCTSLKKISLPSSLTSIGYYSFYECTSLTKIEIPSSVTQIGHSAFEKCSSLKKVVINSSLQEIKDKTFSGCSSLIDIKIPNSVISIGNNCFNGCKSIQHIDIPCSLEVINEGLFSGCSSISEITVPSNVTKIKERAFEMCSSLRKIFIPQTVNKIGDSAFNKCKSLETISLPSLTSIKKYLFNECSSLSQISIPSSVTEIKTYAFNGCTSLKEVIIPESVTEIGSFVFSGCTSLSKISIPNSIVYVGEGAFKGCSSLVEMPISSSLTTIVDSVFEGCSLIKQIIIPSSVVKIGSFAFFECTSLENIFIPFSVTKIGSYAFSKCVSLTQISIPPSVVSIGENLFEGCSSHIRISIPTELLTFK